MELKQQLLKVAQELKEGKAVIEEKGAVKELLKKAAYTRIHSLKQYIKTLS